MRKLTYNEFENLFTVDVPESVIFELGCHHDIDVLEEIRAAVMTEYQVYRSEKFEGDE